MTSSRIAWQEDDWEKCHSLDNNPFDLDEPYEWVVALESEGNIRGNVLDLGCGAGHNGIYLASKGYGVTGVDISSTAIERAKQKAFNRRVAIKFFQADVCEPLDYLRRFDPSSILAAFIPCTQKIMSGMSRRSIDHAVQDREDQLRKAFSQGWTVAAARAQGNRARRTQSCWQESAKTQCLVRRTRAQLTRAQF